ncbi:protein PERCC1-like [Anneissia japonica]|uniref:protein PERCC1-like n=1 Tax=Anneissia japonica TaxID=1529436 RepID=UPI00142562B4|nr:protein PERCC1-like [Anneissia japonica]
MASFSLQLGELDDTGTMQNLQTTVSNKDFMAGSEDGSGLSWEEEFDEFSEEEEEEEEDEVEFQPNISQQLLNFVDIVNKDIQKYFGKRKYLDDVNEDDKRRKNKKSGRELYYADLLRIAKNGDVNDLDENDQKNDSPETLHIINWREKKQNNGRSSPSSLGPLGELFKTSESKNDMVVRGQHLSKQFHKLGSVADIALPWKKRKLPLSFFKEPELRRIENGKDGKRRMNSPNSLDFSDLLAHWIGEDNSPDGRASELSSSSTDMSLQSL